MLNIPASLGMAGWARGHQVNYHTAQNTHTRCMRACHAHTQLFNIVLCVVLVAVHIAQTDSKAQQLFGNLVNNEQTFVCVCVCKSRSCYVIFRYCIFEGNARKGERERESAKERGERESVSKRNSERESEGESERNREREQEKGRESESERNSA